MTIIQIGILKQSDWFKDLSDEILEEILTSATSYFLEPEKTLITIGDQGNSMFLILNGWVKIVIPNSNQEEIIVNQLGPGELVGEMSLIDQNPRSASVIALTELSALEFTHEKFYLLLRKYPEIGIHIISSMSQRMRFTLKYLENAVTWSKMIADGDFSFLDQMNKAKQGNVQESSESDESRANNFLYNFLHMAEVLQDRDTYLQDQLHLLSIHINQAKRNKELQSITSTEFFETLNENIHKIKTDREK